MPKKRKAKRKVKPKRRPKKTKRVKHLSPAQRSKFSRLKGPARIADVLVVIAMAFTLIMSILTLLVFLNKYL